MRSFYEILGVPEDASAEEIKGAFRQLVRHVHPDVAGEASAPRFREVWQAYETLSDTDRRRAYDEQLAAGRTDRDAPGARQWFADEVAIDFPSLSDAVDRICEGFFGSDEAEAPLTAELLLTRLEAFEGVTVPLDVPVRCTCRLCGGRGEVWMEWCGGCNGTGESYLRHRVKLSVPARVTDGARFRFSVTAPFAAPTRVEIRVAVR
jgi:molecular chaperone DnaJ